MTDFRSGFIAVLGKPNAGKSTLVNTLVGEKVAIVSWRPQTTRNKIMGIYNDDDSQIIFIDTPGLHKPRNNLGEFMMKTASTAAEGCDAAIYLIDCEKGIDDTDKFNIKKLVDGGIKVTIAVNKMEQITKEAVFGILTELNSVSGLTAVVPISAIKGKNTDKLLKEVKKLLTDTTMYYPKEMFTDKNMRFMASEIIREKTMRLLDKEVPYGIGVEISEYSERENGIIDIHADIICEKAAHKPIVLGKGGAMIKKIATYARQDLEEMTGQKVFLTVFVKVKEDWRSDDNLLRMLGYDLNKNS